VKTGFARVIPALASLLLSACVSVGIGGDTPAQAHYLLNDIAAPAPRRTGRSVHCANW
jgi:hypothetical protein